MPSRAELEGMTTNERLWSTGLLDEFDAAIEHKDEDLIRRILARVFVDGAAITGIIGNVRQYGMPHDPTSTEDRT